MHRNLRAARLALLWFLGTTASADPLLQLPEPGQPGSHDRYAEALRSEEARIATELLARYQRRIAEAPEDRVAAMERCLFLGVAFYDPDTEENPREEERSACVEEVEARFPADPDVRVFAIEQRWSDEAVEAGRRFPADPPQAAEPRHLAAVHAHLARQLRNGESDGALEHAKQAMVLEPSLDLRLMVAQELIDAGDSAGARTVLSEQLESTQEPWELERKASLLADLGAFEAALAGFREVERRGQQPARQFSYARALAGTGRVEEARAIYSKDRDGWVSDEELQAHFKFELRHGTAASARAAYDSLRARGWQTDLFGRNRLALVAAHPDAAWNWGDAWGLIMLAAIAMTLLLLPALWILPIYGLGMLRGGHATTVSRSAERFGLRHAWAASAILIVGESLALFAYPGALDDSSGKSGISDPDIARAALLGVSLSIGGVLLMVRRHVATLFGRGSWGWVRVVASGALLVLGFRVLAFAIARATGADPSDESTVQMMRSVHQSFGFPVTLVCLALIVPVAEEIVFRGVLLSAFRSRLPALWANVAQASLFGLAHVHPVLSPAFFVLGLGAGRLARASGSLRAPLFAHVLNNAIACAALALAGAG